DNAFLLFPGDRKVTVPQSFAFAAADVDRLAGVSLMAGSVGGADRTSVVRVTTGGVTTDYADVLSSADGPLWDTLELGVVVPAGATDLTVEIISGDGTGTSGSEAASLSWVAATLAISTGDVPPCDGDVTPPTIVCDIVPHCWGISEVVFDATDDCSEVEVEAYFQLSCGQVSVESGDLFKATAGYCCGWSQWCNVLLLRSTSIELVVIATDSSGNEAVCTIDLIEQPTCTPKPKVKKSCGKKRSKRHGRCR
ncbi:MAG: hypothetical protein KDC38_19040, partial [Planctomycetes bacterium]|nr:hypothetical protein [Planctomycetota bacterium]